MYCKLFASLYQGTLRGLSHEILVFTNLLASCDKEGFVDKHQRAIADETGLSVDQVKSAILKLEEPDPESRSPEEDGARLTRMDEHRAWGWHIVNYVKYRTIRNEDDRREQNRAAQERFRAKKKKKVVSLSKPPSAHAEVEGDALLKGDETKNPPVPPKGGVSGKEFNPPTEPEFVAYLVDALPVINPEWTKERATSAAKLQFETYAENGWKDGNGKQVKNWKTKAKNAISYKKPWSFGKAPEPKSTFQSV